MKIQNVCVNRQNFGMKLDLSTNTLLNIWTDCQLQKNALTTKSLQKISRIVGDTSTDNLSLSITRKVDKNNIFFLAGLGDKNFTNNDAEHVIVAKTQGSLNDIVDKVYNFIYSDENKFRKFLDGFVHGHFQKAS